jgi:hypothetical protein
MQEKGRTMGSGQPYEHGTFEFFDQTRAERITPGPARHASYEPQPLRELLKPILDELKDKLESFEGEPTPADHRWLRGQLRKLIDRLDMP